jgi:F-type H+-transporting ATPase subunit epsilon
MADKTFRCRLITPAAQILDEQVKYVSLPAWDGLVGVLPNRGPMVSKLGMGSLRIDFPDQQGARGGTRTFLVEDGFVQMVNNKLTILAGNAIAAETLLNSEAQAELAEAQARKPTPGPSSAKEMDQISRDRARARLKLRLAQESRTI